MKIAKSGEIKQKSSIWLFYFAFNLAYTQHFNDLLDNDFS